MIVVVRTFYLPADVRRESSEESCSPSETALLSAVEQSVETERALESAVELLPEDAVPADAALL